MDPHLLNYVSPQARQGHRSWCPGFCLAIEPMVSLGTPQTEVLADDWTVITTDGTWSSHWEHSVALTEAGPAGPDRPGRRQGEARGVRDRRRRPTRWVLRASGAHGVRAPSA